VQRAHCLEWIGRYRAGDRGLLDRRLVTRQYCLLCVSFALQSSWNVHNGWDKLKAEFNKDYMTKLDEFLRSELAHSFYPSTQDIFKAFDATPLDAVRVVILGQDPYFQEGQATGLAFAVPSGTKLPGSLTNLFRELAANGYRRPPNSDLTTWATQGVLLLNCILTVRAGGPPNSHRRKGWWTRFTNRAIELMNSKDSGVVFCLWGRNAQRKERLITGTHHLVLKASHPSPRSHRALTDSSSFLGCHHFSKVNRQLKAQGDNPIRW
jgi:uracil-DNA glycosylase